MAQNSIPVDALDPANDASTLTLPVRTIPLTEQYIWTQDARPAAPTGAAAQWEFRRAFQIEAAPRQATLYIAASGDVEVALNGVQLLTYRDDRTQRAGFTVHALDVASALRAGDNALAIRVHNLHGAHHTTTNPLTLQFVGGRAIAVKLVPAERGVEYLPLLVSDIAWRGRTLPQASADAGSGADALESISAANYDDSKWIAAASLGAIESNIEFYQWNADAGMYAWPGYVGASPFLMHYSLTANAVVHVYAGSATLEHLERLRSPSPQNGEPFTVQLSPTSASEQSPALTLDFGREVAGRIHLRSTSDEPAQVTVAYGESEEEALHQPFLGARTVYIPAHGEAWGPKSAFRYVRIRFLTDARFADIDLDGIAYPVEYKGSFSSSDPLLNRIWQTGAYTAHACMQDGMWDGVKRDRARWAGDIDVSGRVVNDVFADRFLLEDTLTRLIQETDGNRSVNGIDGYSALWVTAVAEFYRHTGDRSFLMRMHLPLLALLKTMDRDIGPDNLFVPAAGEHVFVEWSPGLHADTAEARRITDLEYLLGYKEAVWLLQQMGDQVAAAHYTTRRDNMHQKARALLMNKLTRTFGPSWQTNAMAVLSGAATEAEYPTIWSKVFSTINQVSDNSPGISPYYGYYVLEAMARLGHRAEAVQWTRDFWGGMIAEGATSFWESYDPRWTKREFHTGLQADGLAGYYVSLAHAWSAGPTAWVMEQLLGVRSTGAGFRTATIQPELAGLQWIEGSVPTPQGIIHLRAESGRITLNLPPEVTATLMVHGSANSTFRLNGAPIVSRAAPLTGYRSIQLDHPGHYEIITN